MEQVKKMNKKLIFTAFTSIVLSACAGPSLYTRMTESQLDNQYCRNAVCQYEIALAFFGKNNNWKGWSYMELSARDGYPDAVKFYINNNKQVPRKDATAEY